MERIVSMYIFRKDSKITIVFLDYPGYNSSTFEELLKEYDEYVSFMFINKNMEVVKANLGYYLSVAMQQNCWFPCKAEMEITRVGENE